MIPRQFTDLIHEWRNWGFDWCDQRVNRLAYIERKIHDFLTCEEVASERAWLVRSTEEERLAKVISRILRPNQPNSLVISLESIKQKLSNLLTRLQKDASSQESQRAFQDLPEDVRNLFYWGIWIDHGAINDNELGKNKLTERLALLMEIQSPIIYLKGKTLCEQVLELYEMRCVLEKQKNTVEILQILSEKMNFPLINNSELQTLLQRLPAELLLKLSQDVFQFSSKQDKEWGSNELMKNPKCLINLRNPQNKAKHLLEQYLQEQIRIQQDLSQVQKVEEFDRVTLLYKSQNDAQRKAMLNKVCSTVREWVSAVETAAQKKQKMRADARYLYQFRGAHPKLSGTQFQVFAPHARQVKLILTAFGSQEHCLSMDRKDLGIFEAYTHLAAPGRTYRYLIEDCNGNWNYRTDPFSYSVAHNGKVLESVVTDIESYVWNDEQWMAERSLHDPCKRPLSIYELHVDSWKKQGGRPLSFHELAWALVDYQKKIPFTHVQLYGLLDNKNDYSWGYQTDHFFAPNRRLGSANDFKFLVDLCHQHDIGVIIDWIPAHYKHEHGGDFSQSLHDFDGTNLFGAEHSYWGTVFFDFKKDETRRFVLASGLYWLEIMHVDGFRVDAVSPMIRRNGENQDEAIHFFKQFNSLALEHYPGTLMIAEETDGFPGVTNPVSQGGLGFNVKLAVHMQHRMRNYLRTSYDRRGWAEYHCEKLLASLNEMKQNEEWLIAHSHDDAAFGSYHNHSTIYGSVPTSDPWRKFADMRLFHAWNLLTPASGHGIHMGDEIGQRWPWNERLQAPEGAVEWSLLDNHPESSYHRGLQECVGDLNRFYRSRQAFWKQGRHGYQLISHHPQNKMIGIRRLDFEGQRLELFFNFSPHGYSQYDFPLSSLSEDPDLRWIKGAREVFNTDGIQYGGTGQFTNTWAFILRNPAGIPTHFRMSLPPLSLVAFEGSWD